jgi:hypothetical protein
MSEQINLHKAGQRLTVWGLTEWKKDRTGDSGTTWTRIGRAVINRDGSMNIFLDFCPNRGQTLQVRPDQPREEQPSGSQTPL